MRSKDVPVELFDVRSISNQVSHDGLENGVILLSFLRSHDGKFRLEEVGCSGGFRHVFNFDAKPPVLVPKT